MKWFGSVPLAGALDEICVHASGMTFREEKAKLEHLESELLAESKGFLQEARRRVAERILSSAVSRKLPSRKCLDYLRQVVKLGFTDLVQEALIRISFCRYLIAVDEAERATAMLRKLKKRCGNARGQTEREIGEIKGIIDALLESINKEV